jgi:hypothetical protein
MLHEDELFSLLIYLNTNRAMYDGNFYYKRRYRPGSIMTSQVQTMKNQNSFESYFQLMEEISKLLQHYKMPGEKKLIKSRLRSIYIGLKMKEVNKKYKAERLSNLRSLNRIEKTFFYIQFLVKEKIRQILKNIH